MLSTYVYVVTAEPVPSKVTTLVVFVWVVTLA
jgi:hypothetical protein